MWIAWHAPWRRIGRVWGHAPHLFHGWAIGPLCVRWYDRS